MSKICTNCAQELSDNATVCNMCGEQLSVINNNVPQSHEPSSRPLYEEPVKTPNHNDTFCKTCGAKLNPGNPFCVKCGTIVTVENPIVSKPDIPPQNKQKKTKRVVVAVSAVVSAVVLLIAVYFGFFIVSKSNATVQSTTDSTDVELKNTADKDAFSISASDLLYVQIEEKYTDKKIIDGASAIESLNDISSVLSLTDASKEFLVKSEAVLDGNNYFRLQQVYNDIPVYGRNVVVMSDEIGTVKGLTSNYQSVVIADTGTRLSDEEISNAIFSEYSKSYDIKQENMEVVVNRAVIYSLSSSAQFAYEVNLFGICNNGSIINEDVIVGQDQTILHKKSNISYNRGVTTAQGQNQQQLVSVDINNGTFTLKDEDKKISVYEAVSEIEYKERSWYEDWIIFPVWRAAQSVEKEIWNSDNSAACKLVKWNEKEKPNASAIDAMANVSVAYDYFANSKRFGKTFTHEKNGDLVQSNVDVVVDIQYMKDDGWGMDWTGNAAHTSKGTKHLIIVGRAPNGETSSSSASLGTMAHEYTHGVVEETAGLGILNDSAAMNEAFADIFSVFVINDKAHYADWNSRHMYNPHHELRDPGNYAGYEWKNKTPFPKHISEKFVDNSLSDDLYAKISCHFNSTIISHAAYLMHNGGIDGEWTKIDNMETLAKIWYGALLTLHADATFEQCRNSVELSARMLMANDKLPDNEKITKEQYATVVKALGDEGVGIKHAPYQCIEAVINDFDLTIINANGNSSHSNYNLEIYKTLSLSELIYSFAKREFPKLKEVLNRGVANSKAFPLTLDDGIYLFELSQGNKSPITVRVKVDGNDKNATDYLKIQTDFDDYIIVILNQQADISEPEKEKLIKLLSFADPAGEMFRVSSTNNIDNEMFFAGILAGYTGYADYEYDFHSVTLPESLSFLDEANTYRINRMTMQSIIKGIYGREMNAPEKHERYYNGYFYFSHWDITHFGGVRHTVDEVYTLSNDYYRITGIAHRYDYGPDIDPIASEVYTAVVKKDTDATHDYYLVAIEYGESGTLEDINREIINAGNTGSSQDSQVDIYAIYDEYLTSKKWQLIDSFSNEMSIDDKTYIDLDSDGIDELLITASTGIDYGDSSASALLAIVNNEVVCSLSAWTLNTSGSQQEQLMIVVEDSSNKPFLAKKGFRNAWGDYGSTLVVYNFSNGTVSERRSFIEMSTGNIDEIKAETNLVYPSYDEYSIMFYMIDGDYVTDAHYKQEASFYVES